MSKMNKPLANYYHEARAQVKKLKTMQEENKKRAERRAEIIAPVAADPLQNLFISGTSCKVLRGAESHAMNEAGENLVPWNGQQDNMIDRFDVRALLDFYKEPDPRVLAARQKSNEALKLEQTLRFESYRDLVRLAARGLSEAQGLATVDAESLDRRAAQHAALQAATDAVYFNPKPGAAGGPGTAAHGATPAGSGVYSAMGFSYDASAAGPARAAGAAATPAAAAAAADSSDSSSDDESDDDSEDEAALTGCGAGGLAGPVSEADLAQEAEDERVDDMAEAYGLADFSYRLHRSLEKEGEEEARMRKRPKKNMSRKKAANRAKRMTGMGLDPSTGLPLHQHNPYKDPRALINPWQDSRAAGNASPDRPHHRRGSPDYEAGGWRVRERSPTPPRPGEKQYITEFVSSDAAGAAGDGFMGGSNSARPGIIEALPDRPDPAMLGGIQPVARGVMTLQGIKRGDLHMRLKMAAEEDDMPAYRRRSPTPPPRRRASSRSRSRSPGRRRLSSRSRSRSRSGSRELHRRGGDRDRDRRARHRSRSQSRSRSRSRDRDRHCRTNEKDRDRRSRRSSRSRSRSRSRDRRQRRSSDGGGSRHPGSSGKAAGGSYSSGKGAAAAGASSRAGAAVGGGGSAAAKASAAAGAAAPKESAQERLKRLMQAQLNKAAQKDSLANAQKKIQAEKDKVARQQIERVARQRGRSPSPGARDRSRSPPRHRPGRRSYSP